MLNNTGIHGLAFVQIWCMADTGTGQLPVRNLQYVAVASTMESARHEGVCIELLLSRASFWQ